MVSETEVGIETELLRKNPELAEDGSEGKQVKNGQKGVPGDFSIIIALCNLRFSDG